MKRRRSLRSLGLFGVVTSLAALTLAAGCGDSEPTPASPSASGAGGAVAGAATVGGTGTGGAGPSAGGSSAGTVGSGGSAGQAGEGAAGSAGAGAQGKLQIYWVDVEGGAATILIAPNGEVVVVDAGFPGERDAGRIAKVLQDEAQTERIDYMITTHYHNDHVGGVPALAALLPISHFYDHGPTVEPGSEYDNYVATAGDKRVIAKPGDKLTLGDLQLTFVTSAGKMIAPMPGALANALCPSNVTKPDDGGAENGMSLGFVADFGTFRFLDLADLTWAEEQELMCPSNRIGTVDLYQVNHHGLDISNSPQLVHAVAPVVAVMNNGANKGGSPEAFETLKSSPGLQDVWALHRATGADAEHNAEPDLTANLESPDEAHWLKAVVEASGAFTLSNGRNAASRTYPR